MIGFQLDETSGVATYLQQVHQALRMGMLESGDRLPTAQQVVAKLAISPNTGGSASPRVTWLLIRGFRAACTDRLAGARGPLIYLLGHCLDGSSRTGGWRLDRR